MIARSIEWWITYGRLATFAIVGALTFVTAYFAVDVRMDIPRPNLALNLDHPIVVAQRKYQNVPAHNDPLLIAISAPKGDILSEDYVDQLEELSVRLEAIPGVMLGSVRTVLSAETTAVLKTQSGPLQVPVASQTTTVEEGSWSWDFREMHRRIILGDHFSRWVTDDLKASLVTAELDPILLATGDPSAYRQIAMTFEEQIRMPLTEAGFQVRAQGRPFEIADETTVWYTSRLLVVASLGIMALGLLLLVTPRSTAFVMFCPSIAAIWTVGTAAVLNIEMTASFLAIGAIVFLVGALDGAQRAYRYEDAKRKSHGADAAAGRAMHAAFGVPLVNYLVFGFFIASWSFFRVPSLQGQSLFGLVALVFTMIATIILLPALLGWRGPSHPPSRGGPFRRRLKPLKTAGRVVAPLVAVLFSLILYSLAFQLPKDVQTWRLFSVSEGVAVQRFNNPDLMEAWFPRSANPGTVFVDSTRDGCADPVVIDYLDRLSWRLANVPAVADVKALPFEVRQMIAGWRGNDLRKVSVPTSDTALVQVLGSMTNATQYNYGCRIFPIRIFLKNRTPGSVSDINSALDDFVSENKIDGLSVSALAGPAALGAVVPIMSTKGIYQTWPTLIVGLLILMSAIVRDWRAPTIGLIVVGCFSGMLFLVGPFGSSGALPADIPIFLMSVGLAATMLVYAISAMHGQEDDSETDMPAGYYHLRMVWWPWLVMVFATLATLWLWTLAPFDLTADAGRLVFTVAALALVLTLGLVPLLWILFGLSDLEHFRIHAAPPEKSTAQGNADRSL